MPKHVGGSELYTYHLAKGLQNRDHEVSVYTREDGRFDKQFTEEDSKYDGLKVKTIYFNSPKNNGRACLLKKLHFNFYVPFLQQGFSWTPRRGVHEPSRLKSRSLGSIIGQFKSVCTRRIRSSGCKTFAWQTRYYDHIIRDEIGMHRIRKYILENPTKWSLDEYYREETEQ